MRNLLLALLLSSAAFATDRTLYGTKIDTYSGILTIPLVTDTLVTRTSTDTLTNKSISGSTNTITNVPNASVVHVFRTITSADSPYTTLSTDEFIKCDATSGSVTVVLTGATNTWLHIKKTDASTNPCILDPASTDTIDGVSSYSLTIQNQAAGPYKGGATSWLNF